MIIHRVKDMKNCQIVELDGFWGTEYNTNILGCLQCTVSEKSRKTVKKHFFLRTIFFFFFRNRTWQWAEVFCVAFSVQKPFFWAILINNPMIIQIFHHKGWTLWFRGVQIVGGSKIENKLTFRIRWASLTVWHMVKIISVCLVGNLIALPRGVDQYHTC